MQIYFVNNPWEANKFPDYLMELAELGPYNLANPLDNPGIMMEHGIFSKYIEFCCFCSLVKQYPDALPQELLLAITNMAIVLREHPHCLNEQSLVNCMKFLVEQGISFLASENNIKNIKDNFGSLFKPPPPSPDYN